MTITSPDEIWAEAWTEALTSQERKTDIAITDWRAAGRKTKDKPRGEHVEFWTEEGLRVTREYESWLKSTGWKIATFNGEPLIEFNVSGTIGDVSIKGYVDAVFDMEPGLLVVDYKTGTRAQPGPHQLALYAVLMKKLGLPAPEWGAFYSTRKGELGPIEGLAHWDEKWWEKQFTALSVAKEHELFLPHISDQCRGCGVNQFCYAYGGANSAQFDPDDPNYNNMLEGDRT